MSVTRINPQIQCGEVQVSNVGTTEVTQHVTFPRAYASAPKVVACFWGASYNRRMHVGTVTATGFDIVFATNSNASAWCGAYWIAMP